MARSSTTWESKYSDDEKRAALELGATVGRNAACRQLGISKSLFQKWTEQFPELWSSLRSGDRTVHRTRVAQNLEDLAEQYAAVELDALERAEKLVPRANARELAALMKAMGSSRGVATVGARGYRGEDADRLEIDINFGSLEAAAQAILESVSEQRALPTPNLAEATDVVEHS